MITRSKSAKLKPGEEVSLPSSRHSKIKQVSFHKKENKHSGLLLVMALALGILAFCIFMKDFRKQQEFHDMNHDQKTSTCIGQYVAMNCDNPIPQLQPQCQRLNKCLLEKTPRTAITLGILASTLSLVTQKVGWVGVVFLSATTFLLLGVCLRGCTQTTTVQYHYH